MMREPKTPPANALQKEVWAFLVSHMHVTREDVRQACPGSNNSINVYLGQLVAEGVLRSCGREGRRTIYTVHEAADLVEMTAGQRASPEGAIWRTIRIMREFTPPDIEAALIGAEADVDPRRIQTYSTLLVRAGYLQVLRKAGKVRPAHYRLIRDTGPLPPVEKRLPVVIDGNEDRIVYAKGERL
ncbi:hypothetical protein QO034_06375 [Sedimentitalea sp. JM2-8]|uniref:Sugar-specific transcriptional regulator TrmB n=1 Tax=Sedimentitalea xiamensis TaxID=3050037 RepID=A0ABT7FC82_9RHOB|nr:hypothetical protein [Sedimentitalea xiamensis]MDK3072729.1 hypothetical protein [Sedimentitalea xiamensis]